MRGTSVSRYANLVIYYFSGTGNALKAATWIAEQARASGMTVHVLSIERAEPVPPLEGETLVGFCYPTHGFFAPWLVAKFLWAFRALPGSNVFFLNTRAGVRLWPIWLPGLSGLATWAPLLLLALRGYGPVGMLPLDPPHSWICMFPPITRWGIGKLMDRAERITREFASAVCAGKRYFRWSVWLTLPLDLAMAPITLLYVFLGRFMLAKVLFANNSCNACGLCVDMCPVGAIKMVGNRPYWQYTCESCMRCMNVCVRRSIESWFTRMMALSGALVWGVLLVYPMDLTLLSLLLCPVLFPIYWALHGAWGNRRVNAAFTATSLTHYWGRYLAPGVKKRHLPTLQDPRAQAKSAPIAAE
jgi:ferredoxin